MKEYRAGIYLRLSGEDLEKNNSIEAQREITRKYALEKGYTIVKEYVDNGYSGILDSRPSLNQMIVDITKGFLNMVIVKDISRLTRDKNKTGWYTEVFFPDNDVRFISVTEFIDSGKRYEIDDSIMLRGIVNQHYITDISKKIRSSKQIKKQKGEYVESKVPYGYKKREDNPYQIEIDKKVEPIIKLIFNKSLTGGTGRQIANYLNNKKIPTPSQYFCMKNAVSKWNSETINEMLSNPFYIGNTILNKYITNCLTKKCRKNKKKDTWEIKENTHEGIIPKEIYQKVQERKERYKKTKNNQEYLLKDLVYCGNCHHKAQYKVWGSTKGFHCGILYKTPQKCTNKVFIKEEDINSIILEQIQQKWKVIEKKKLQEQIIEKAQETKKISQCDKKIHQLERKKVNLYEEKSQKQITIEEFKERYTEIKEKIQEEKKQIENLKKQIQDLYIPKKIENLKEINNALLKKIIKKINIKKEYQIEIIFF